MVDKFRRAATNRRYYIKRKYGLKQQSSPLLKLEDCSQEIRDKIIRIKSEQQKMPVNFFKTEIKGYCEVCNNTNSADLVAHHIKYVPIEEVITVCLTCHKLIHGRNLGFNKTRKIEAINNKLPKINYIV